MERQGESGRHQAVGDALRPLLERITARIIDLGFAPEEDVSARAEAEWRRVAPLIGVPLRLVGASFEAGRPEPTLLRARRWLDEDYSAGRCLVVSGPTGVGKSFSAAAILRAARGWRRFWYFPALCGAWLDPEARRAEMAQARQIPLAVFDDFGTEYVKRGGLLEALLDELVWHREANALATVFTTNLTVEELRERLSDRIVDRLRGEWGRVFECPGPSLRKRGDQ